MTSGAPRWRAETGGRGEKPEGAPPWLDAALEGVHRLIRSVEPPLGDRLAWIAARLGRMNGGGSLAAALSAPASTPFLALVEALREDMSIPAADPRVALIGEGAVLLYIHVRVQDDLVDEPAVLDRGYVFAMEVFSSASSRAFASAVMGSPAFFAFREEVMRGFAETAVWEVDVIRSGRAEAGAGSAPAMEARSVAGADADLAWIGRKFLPMAVPLGALAFTKGRAPEAPRIIELVTALGGGLQMANDILNVGEDHAAGRLTPVLRWLYAGGRACPADPMGHVRAALASDEALERALSHARGEVERAASIALEMDAPRVAAVARGRAAFLDSAPERLLALCLGGGAL